MWTVSAPAAAAAVPYVHAFWKALGADPVPIAPDDHDRLVAVTSHLPQLAANALASVLAARGIQHGQLGPGGRDMTRLAGSNAEMWRDLLKHAQPELGSGLRSLSEELARMADLLESGDVDALGELMRSTRAWRQR